MRVGRGSAREEIPLRLPLYARGSAPATPPRSSPHRLAEELPPFDKGRIEEGFWRGQAALHWIFAFLILACFVGCGAPEAGDVASEATPDPTARHLLLITVDTWRGDHLASSRAGVELTPELARFADRSVRFTAAQSVGNATSPGVAGILTGWFPFRSGVVENRCILPPKLPTLGTRLREAGFTTAGFVANPVIGPGFGFEQGFERYELLPRQGHKVPGEAITEAGLAWLEQHAGRDRLFLWLHYMEPHGPYTPPPELRERFALEGFDAPRDIPLKPEGDNRGKGAIPWYQQLYHAAPPTRDGRDYEARYAAEVLALDRQVARVLEALERHGLAETTAVILTSDHGEALSGDHGYYFSHANELTQDQVHVPLVLAHPGATPEVVDQPVSTADVVPTALELLGLPADPDLDGTSLLSREPRPAVSQSAVRLALRWGDWKIGFHEQTGEWLLFDLGADPGETTDLEEARPERFAELKDLLTRARRRPPQAKPILRDDPAEQEKRKELEALGYL